MAQSVNKTNAARLLDRAKVAYRLIPYPVDPDHLEASHVADAIGEDINRVFKTLVLHGAEARHYFVCVVPGNREVDLKAAARAAATKKADLIPLKELSPLTGYIRGGCSPIGLKKPFPIFIDSSALDFDSIYISAGQRGLQFELNPNDLIKFTGATVAPIATTTTI